MESATLDFEALALEIVSSLEGKESEGAISEEVNTNGNANANANANAETNKPGLSECRWDDECTSKQNQVVFQHQSHLCLSAILIQHCQHHESVRE